MVQPSAGLVDGLGGDRHLFMMPVSAACCVEIVLGAWPTLGVRRCGSSSSAAPRSSAGTSWRRPSTAGTSSRSSPAGGRIPASFPTLEHLAGDRDGDLAALAGREFDAVIDTCGYVPRVVRASAELLAGSIERYVFVSTISVYDDAAVLTEATPIRIADDPDDARTSAPTTARSRRSASWPSRRAARPHADHPPGPRRRPPRLHRAVQLLADARRPRAARCSRPGSPRRGSG